MCFADKRKIVSERHSCSYEVEEDKKSLRKDLSLNFKNF